MLLVLIIEDHLLVRQGLKQVLNQEYGTAVICEAGTAEEGTSMLAERAWTLIILDISLPGNDGFSVLEQARRLCPDARVLMLSMHPEQLYGVRSRDMGASGYVCKSAGRSELLRAIHAVLSKREYFPALPASGETPHSPDLHSSVSPKGE